MQAHGDTLLGFKLAGHLSVAGRGPGKLALVCSDDFPQGQKTTKALDRLALRHRRELLEVAAQRSVPAGCPHRAHLTCSKWSIEADAVRLALTWVEYGGAATMRTGWANCRQADSRIVPVIHCRWLVAASSGQSRPR